MHSRQFPAAEAQDDPREVVALQARMLLFQRGLPGTLTIRRTADDHHRIELEFGDGVEKYTCRGEVAQVGLSLVQLGLEFHRLA